MVHRLRHPHAVGPDHRSEFTIKKVNKMLSCIVRKQLVSPVLGQRLLSTVDLDAVRRDLAKSRELREQGQTVLTRSQLTVVPEKLMKKEIASRLETQLSLSNLAPMPGSKTKKTRVGRGPAGKGGWKPFD